MRNICSLVTIFIFGIILFPGRTNGVYINKSIVLINTLDSDAPRTDEMKPITKTQRTLIKLLRKKVSRWLYKDEEGYFQSEEHLYRWLNFKVWDVDAAFRSLETNIFWRWIFSIEALGQEMIEEDMFTDFPFEVEGHDKKGCPVLLWPFGDWDVEKYVTTTTTNPDLFDKIRRMNRQFFSVLEKTLVAVRKNYTTCAQAVALVDTRNFTSNQLQNIAGMGVYLSAAKALGYHYPGLFKSMIFINANQAVVRLLQLFTPEIESNFKSINVYGEDESVWKPKILKLIDAEEIPSRYGGTKDTINDDMILVLEN